MSASTPARPHGRLRRFTVGVALVLLGVLIGWFLFAIPAAPRPQLGPPGGSFAPATSTG